MHSRQTAIRMLAGLIFGLGICSCARVQQESFALPNGLQVEVVAVPRCRRAGAALLFEVGGDHDPEARSGMSRLAGWMLRPAGDIAAERDFTAVRFSVERGALGPALDAMAAQVARPKVTEDLVRRGQVDLLRELAAARGGDALRAAVSFAAEAIRPSRGGGWTAGVAEEISSITAPEVEGFLQSAFGARHARLVVMGGLDLAETRKRIESVFASLPAGAPVVERPPEDSRVSGTLVMGDAPSAVALAVTAPRPQEADYAAFLVLAARFSGAFSPVERPEGLFITAPIPPGQRGEAVAARLRQDVAAAVARPLASGEGRQAVETYRRVLGTEPPTRADCEADPAALALARARAAQLRIDGAALAASLREVDAPRLSTAAARFEPQRTAAVAAGGGTPQR
jgi:hypothetical protein